MVRLVVKILPKATVNQQPCRQRRLVLQPVLQHAIAGRQDGQDGSLRPNRKYRLTPRIPVNKAPRTGFRICGPGNRLNRA